jgi:hypothetical protein
MAMPAFLCSIIDWLRAGYPEGVPQHDYVPLFALLGTQLTDDELRAIADELAASADPASATALCDAITRVHGAGSTQADLARVRAHLAAGGWPLAPLKPAQPAEPSGRNTYL